MVYGLGSRVSLLKFMVYGLRTLHPKPDTHPVQHMLCCIGVCIHVRVCATSRLWLKRYAPLLPCLSFGVEAVCTAVAIAS